MSVITHLCTDALWQAIADAVATASNDNAEATAAANATALATAVANAFASVKIYISATTGQASVNVKVVSTAVAKVWPRESCVSICATHVLSTLDADSSSLHHTASEWPCTMLLVQ